MTLEQFNKKLDKLLIDYLKEKNYVKTGSLLKSIKFNCKFNERTYNFDVEFDANEYILYLEDGDLIQNFMSDEKTEKVIAQFIASQITLT